MYSLLPPSLSLGNSDAGGDGGGDGRGGGGMNFRFKSTLHHGKITQLSDLSKLEMETIK